MATPPLLDQEMKQTMMEQSIKLMGINAPKAFLDRIKFGQGLSKEDKLKARIAELEKELANKEQQLAAARK